MVMIIVVIVTRIMVDLHPFWSIPQATKGLFIFNALQPQAAQVRDPVHYWIDTRCLYVEIDFEQTQTNPPTKSDVVRSLWMMPVWTLVE